MSTENSNDQSTTKDNSRFLDLPFDFPPGIRPYDDIPIIEATHEINYYEVLGITSSANREEIHAAFNTMAKYYHPDRLNRLLARNPIEDPESFKAQCSAIFQLIADAWNTLGDNQKRPEYDFRNNFSYDIDLKQKFRTSRELAEITIENMTMSSAMIDKEEYAAGRYGLYITEAYYGVFRYNIKPNESIVKNAMGPYENVRIPIVNMIINHKIMAHPPYSYMNQDTLSDLPGFYDVSPGQEKFLIIRYKYDNKNHQVIINDNEAIEIPKREHIVKVSSPKSAKKTQKSTSIVPKTKNRSINLFAVLLTGIGAYCLLSFFRYFRKN